jgi:hypothetical protein
MREATRLQFRDSGGCWHTLNKTPKQQKASISILGNKVDPGTLAFADM